MDTLAVIAQLERAAEENAKATRAAFALIRSQIASQADDDEWTRLPGTKNRCTVSNYSRTHVNRLIEAGTVRRKKVGTSTFYSAADMRRYIANS